MAAPFDRAFDALREGRGGAVPPAAIPWRKNEVVYVVPQVLVVVVAGVGCSMVLVGVEAVVVVVVVAIVVVNCCCSGGAAAGCYGCCCRRCCGSR